MKRDKREDELRPEYRREDLGKGVRGKYYKAYKSARNLVLLEPEVAKAFPDDKPAYLNSGGLTPGAGNEAAVSWFYQFHCEGHYEPHSIPRIGISLLFLLP